MRFTPVKRYPLIGAIVPVPVDAIDIYNPLTGWELSAGASVAFNTGDTVTLANKRGKYLLVFPNSSLDTAMVVTPQIVTTVNGYAVEDQAITIPADDMKVVGPFSANFEDAGVVSVVTSGVGGNCFVAELP